MMNEIKEKGYSTFYLDPTETISKLKFKEIEIQSTTFQIEEKSEVYFLTKKGEQKEKINLEYLIVNLI